MALQVFGRELRRLRRRGLQRLDSRGGNTVEVGFRVSGLLQHLDREPHGRNEIRRRRYDVRGGARNSAAPTEATTAAAASAEAASAAAAHLDLRVQLAHLLLQLLTRFVFGPVHEQ